MPPKIDIDREKIADFCRRHHIRKLWLFGSVLRDDFREDSDIDVLYEFEPDCIIGYKIFDIEEELSQLFNGKPVDLVSEKHLNRHIRNHPDFNSRMIYEER
ncbi:nucleotidyltransferase domain-containing protein [bacterium]|nr:nucleotidyltransferase domain-containing protein [bacterium]